MKYIDDLLQDGNLRALSKVDGVVHYIRTIATEYTKEKDLISIDYKTDLLSYVRLDPTYEISNDGLLTGVSYMHGDNPVIKISETYTYNQKDIDANVPLAKRTIEGRVKRWEYYDTEGNLDTSEAEGTYKVKEKLYRTNQQSMQIGAKRRFNIKSVASERVGTALVVLGIANGSVQAYDILRQFSKEHSTDFTEYESLGSLDIVDSLGTATDAWLDAVLPDNSTMAYLVSEGQMDEATRQAIMGATSYYGLEDVAGKTLRVYLQEKLKGNLK